MKFYWAAFFCGIPVGMGIMMIITVLTKGADC